MNASRSALRSRIERLVPEQRALLAERLNIGADPAPAAPQQLVAWIVPAGAEIPDNSDVAAFLRERLPEHMVPSLFMIVDVLPRLPNGKVDAAVLPDPVRPAPDAAGFVPPRNAREEALARVWAAVLGLDRVGVHDNFFELGGDSILSIQVVARAKRAGLLLTPDLVFEHQTLGALAGAARTATHAHGPRASLATAALSPIQAWFFEQPIPAPHHWHQAVWLRPEPDFDVNRFERTIHRIVAHHDALRLSFRRIPSGWTQHLAGQAAVTVRDVVVPRCSDGEFADVLARTADDICAATDLARGPLLHAAVVRREGQSAERILLALHHLAVDAVSWEILLDDLGTVYRSDGDASGLAHATSFLSWCDALARVAGFDLLDADAAYWTALPLDVPQLPREGEGAFLEGGALTATAALDREETQRLLHDIHGAYNTNVEDVLLTALGRTLTDWMHRPRVLVGVERHGREALVDGADLSRTIGWMTSYFPVVLESAFGCDAGVALRTTKDHLRAIPHRGVGYGVVRYLRDDTVARDLANGPEPEVIFNHAGRVDGPASPGAPWQLLGPPFPSRAPGNGRAHRMEVNTFVAGGSLCVLWTAGSEQYGRATIERLALRFIDELRALIAHALTARTSGFTPADFPEVGLSQDELDRFLGGLGA